MLRRIAKHSASTMKSAMTGLRTMGFSSSVAFCSSQRVYFLIRCQSWVQSRRGRLPLGITDTWLDEVLPCIVHLLSL